MGKLDNVVTRISNLTRCLLVCLLPAMVCIAGLGVNHGISNTVVLEIPYFTTKTVI